MANRSYRQILERSGYGALVGVIYAMVTFSFRPIAILISSFLGASIGLLTALLDRWLYRTELRRRRFVIVLLVRTFAYLLVISLSLILFFGIYTALDREGLLRFIPDAQRLSQWLASWDFAYTVVYILLILLVLQFVTLVSRLLGPNVLLDYMLGRFHIPKEEERIFMFMDLRASTTIAERLGHLKWHYFLNDFFYDIAEPVRKSRGEIYQYVGDEVVISWPKTIGIKNLNCIHAFFGIWDTMARRKEYYLETYGYEPVFKAGYHVGMVVIGEIGDFKRDIVFHGDTVNTASRIQMECNHYNRRLLMSDTLLNQLDLKEEYTSEYITKIKLRGKEQIIELYSLDPVEPLVQEA
ncbi:MAG: adenylate/guanylate cyclase domain-containing protein [Bacteroidia bacterium]|nr:adenylate/guanylate cyclase domain-containing protein [Bacteroidia bacterium]